MLSRIYRFEPHEATARANPRMQTFALLGQQHALTPTIGALSGSMMKAYVRFQP
jgi:hypothetical protein